MKEEFEPYRNLIAEIIYRAIIENDIGFLHSENCKKYLALININHQSMLEWLNRIDKDKKFYPEFYLKWNFSDKYRRCNRCLKIKYINSFVKSIENSICTGDPFYASTCTICKRTCSKEYYHAKKRA